MSIMNPFQVSEICQLIAHHLSKQDLAQSSRVCKDWKASFLPSTWHTISLYSSDMVPTRKAQAKYGHFMRELSLSGFSAPKYLLLQCSNLTSLSIYYPEDPVRSTLSKVPQLTKLFLREVGFLDSAGFWKVASQKLMSLRHLSAAAFGVDPDAIEYFWITCSRLETLKLQDIKLPKPPNTSLIFLKMRKLKTFGLYGFSEQDLQILISRCPNLQRFTCMGEEPKIPDTMFSSPFVQESWPMLESLSIVASLIPDHDLAQILDGMRTITVLKADLTRFGPISFAALRPHFHELQKLFFSTFRGDKPDRITGTMLHEILISCRNLVKLGGLYVSAEDVIADSTPWISTKLELLSLDLTFPPDCDPSLHRAIFEQLSRLTSLETLSLRSFDDRRYSRYSLDFRLSRGMAQLKGLTRLRFLRLEGTIQQMEKEDYQWLFENLEGFSGFYGKPNQDPNKIQEIRELETVYGLRARPTDWTLDE